MFPASLGVQVVIRFLSAISVFCGVACLGTGVATNALAESRDERRQRNCAHYQEMSTRALDMVGEPNLTPEFLKDSNAFIEAGCLSNKPVCPKTEADFAFADLIIMMSVSANMGSTFTPFRCPVEPGPGGAD
ncbi:hypothetical protein FIV00_21945 [Labrenzia sp. THAF82]|uniref:hypothetical protein n=1 Tax=Labrenzia sp. THAF82 TaxID=2587861 RepID=UPI0012690FBF|nr:hypothetical protein [Labrenzia sp. THAF82]QFT33171.1 hypothetical protein FIV00_21945 [Labrenzia sp. THAF82]